MNRILVIIVVILLPIAVFMEEKSSDDVVFGDTVDKISLELPVIENKALDSKEEVVDDNKTQVLVSNNKDKSNPYYLDIEEYIIGVVAGEMPASFNIEALKAQAVAARSYALYKMQNIKDYVLSTNINDQVYLSIEEMRKKWGSDFDFYYAKVRDAVEATKGEVLTFDGKIIQSYYFAISNGYTEPSQAVFNETRDYLVSVESVWDKNYKSISSSRTIKKDTFCNKLNISCGSITISNVVRSDTNYVREITINGTHFTGIEVFNKLGLKSTDFTITVNGDDVVIGTEGFGHGVGMSQYGAQGMASQQYNYQDILKHYYKNVEISKITV